MQSSDLVSHQLPRYLGDTVIIQNAIHHVWNETIQGQSDHQAVTDDFDKDVFAPSRRESFRHMAEGEPSMFVMNEIILGIERIA